MAIAFIMQYMASGYGWAAAHKRIEAHAMIGAGVLVAGLTGIGSWFFGFPFLTSTYGYFHLPLIGEFELASAMAFDLGVFLTVVGTVLLALSQISGSGSGPNGSPSRRDRWTGLTRTWMSRSCRRQPVPHAARRSDWNFCCQRDRRADRGGVYLVLRGQSFPVIIGLAFLSYAVNLFLFAMGRLTINHPPIIDPNAPGYTDPLPQALVLTAIVISFGMTALIVVLALRSFLETGSDDVRAASLDVADTAEKRGGQGVR